MGFSNFADFLQNGVFPHPDPRRTTPPRAALPLCVSPPNSAREDLTKTGICGIILRVRGVAQVVGRNIWDVEAASSSLATPRTAKCIKSREIMEVSGDFLFWGYSVFRDGNRRGYHEQAGF